MESESHERRRATSEWRVCADKRPCAATVDTSASLALSARRQQQRPHPRTAGGRGRRNGWMESTERVELPAAFEDVDVDILVQLIGTSPLPPRPAFAVPHLPLQPI